MRSLRPVAANFRAEIARYRISQKSLANVIKTDPGTLSQQLNGVRPLTYVSSHNIAWGIHQLTGKKMFDINPDIGLLRMPRGRQSTNKRPRGVHHYPLLPV